jgi:hypothetical protein
MSDIDTILREIKPRVMSWIGQSTSAVSATGGVKDHGLLVGLADDDHTQYVHINTARSISVQHTFAPTSPAAPFALNANAQSQLVTGLYADQLNKSVSVSGLGLSGGGSLIADRTITLASSSNPGATASILATNSSGELTVEKLYLGSAKDVDLYRSNADTLMTDDSFIIGGTSLMPNISYRTNIGSISKKYLQLYAAELWVETLVAQNTLATIGGRILVAPTTTLTTDLAAASTTIYVKHNQLANNDIVYLEADGKVEFILITSGATADPPNGYYYSCTRDLDGSGANDWYAGDAALNTGTTGDGFIDIYSMRSVRSAAHIGPTILGNVRTGTTYSDLGEVWAIGNLNGLYGYGTDTYGVGIGRYASSMPNIVMDSTNGLRIRNYTSNVMEFKTDGSALISGTMSVTGTLTAGDGVVWLDEDGYSLQLASSLTDAHRIKWVESGFRVIWLEGALESGVLYKANLEVDTATAGTDAAVFLSATSPHGTVAIGVRADSTMTIALSTTHTQIFGDAQIEKGLTIGSTTQAPIDKTITFYETTDPSTPFSPYGILWAVDNTWVKYIGHDAYVLNWMAGKTYTPTWSSDGGTQPSLGNGTLDARYHVFGRLCQVWIRLVFGSSTTFGTGNHTFSLPFTSRNGTVNYYGVAHFRDAATANYYRAIQIGANASTISYWNSWAEGSNVSLWTPTSPFAMANGDGVNVNIIYELSGPE